VRRQLPPLAALLVALAVIGVLVALAVIPPADDTDPSSRSAGKQGTLALYTWLGNLGLDVSRISGGFDVGGADILVEYAPEDDFSAADLSTVTGFVRSGGDLILAIDRASLTHASAVLTRLLVGVEQEVPAGTAHPAQPFVPANDVHSVATGDGYALRERDPLVPLLRQNGAVVAAAVRLGSGRAYVLGDARPLSNDGLRHDDSAYLFLGLLSRARGGRVAFDEVHHGEVNGSAGAPGIFEGPIGVAAALAVMLVLAALALTGRRVGRPVASEATVAVPSATTYVSAMGDLFARSRQRSAIAARYAEELKRRVGAAVGVAPALDDAAFVAALAATGSEHSAEVAQLLRRARELSNRGADDRALLQLARDVAVAEAEWTLTPQLRP
jgi:hypothetical protein